MQTETTLQLTASEPELQCIYREGVDVSHRLEQITTETAIIFVVVLPIPTPLTFILHHTLSLNR